MAFSHSCWTFTALIALSSLLTTGHAFQTVIPAAPSTRLVGVPATTTTSSTTTQLHASRRDFLQAALASLPAAAVISASTPLSAFAQEELTDGTDLAAFLISSNTNANEAAEAVAEQQEVAEETVDAIAWELM